MCGVCVRWLNLTYKRMIIDFVAFEIIILLFLFLCSEFCCVCAFCAFREFRFLCINKEEQKEEEEEKKKQISCSIIYWRKEKRKERKNRHTHTHTHTHTQMQKLHASSSSFDCSAGSVWGSFGCCSLLSLDCCSFNCCSFCNANKIWKSEEERIAHQTHMIVCD